MAAPLKPPAWWRPIVLCLAAIVAVLQLPALNNWPSHFLPEKYGTLRAKLEPAGHRHRIVALAAGSPLAAAQAKPGDYILFERIGDRTRIVFETGETIRIRHMAGKLDRDLKVQPVADATIPMRIRIAYAANTVTGILALLLGVAIAWRLPHSVPARFLALALFVTALSFGTDALPGGDLRDARVLVTPLFIFAARYILFAGFCVTLATAPAGALSLMRRAFPVYAGVGVLLGLHGIAYMCELSPLEHAPLARAFAIFSVLASLTALALARRAAPAADRTWISWIGVSVGLVYLSYLGSNLLTALGFHEARQYYGLLVVPPVLIAGLGGLCYAMLRYRMFDVAFVVNRVLVYGAVSVFLLVVFGVAEAAVHKLLEVERFLLRALLFVAVLLTFHKVRHYAEVAVEKLLFRDWHEKEERLGTFVKEAARIRAQQRLVDNFEAAVRSFLDGAAATVYLMRPDGRYKASRDEAADGGLERDHPLPRFMEAHACPAFHNESWNLPDAQLALPMLHRGELKGFLLLGRKARDLNYRPDEMRLLESVTQRIGLELYALELDRLREEVAELKGELASARSQVDALIRATRPPSSEPSPAAPA